MRALTYLIKKNDCDCLVIIHLICVIHARSRRTVLVFQPMIDNLIESIFYIFTRLKTTIKEHHTVDPYSGKVTHYFEPSDISDNNASGLKATIDYFEANDKFTHIIQLSSTITYHWSLKRTKHITPTTFSTVVIRWQWERQIIDIIPTIMQIKTVQWR